MRLVDFYIISMQIIRISDKLIFFYQFFSLPLTLQLI
jgi:hypothetical protein